MRVLLFAGKGGVGKTSLALASALAAAEHGHRVFVLSTDAAHSLGDALGRPVGACPVEVADGVTAQEVAPLAELERSWSAIQRWLRALLFEDEGPAAEELLVAPGLEELVALRAVREVERGGRHDLCVVDCAPTGGLLRLLRLPDLLRHATEQLSSWRRGVRWLRPLADRLGAGPLLAPEEVLDAFEQLAAEVEGARQILLDEERSRVRLVLCPARVIVEESRRTFASLCLYGVTADAVVANRLLPAGASGGYFARWCARERAELAAIEASFPVPVLRAPLRPQEPIGASALGALGREVYGGRDPAAPLAGRRPIRLAERAGTACLEIDLPGTRAEEVEVSVRGSLLCVGLRNAQRRFALPASLVGRRVAAARCRDGVLEVRFAPRAVQVGAP